MVARIITATGYTYDQAEALTLPRLTDLLAYWADAPPTHELAAGIHAMIAAYFGVDLKGGRGAEAGSTVDPAGLSDDAGGLFSALEEAGVIG